MTMAIAEPPPKRAEKRRKIEAVQTASRNSSELLPKLIADHQAEVWRYLRVLGCPADAADDLTQETFLIALCRPFEYRGRAAAAAYLRRTAYHRYLSHVQSTKTQLELREAEVTEATWSRWHSRQRDDGEILDVLQDCLAALPRRSRHALELRYRDGCSRREIAKRLSLSEHGAKNLMQRAKKHLRESVEVRVNSAIPR